MLRFAIISIFLWLNFVHLASSTCSDLTYSKCKGFGDAFESIDNIAERVCQDDFCKAFPNCNYWLYNRESGECYLYENEPIGSHSCNTVGGIPWENPDEICDDAQGCELFQEGECRHDGNILENFGVGDITTCRNLCQHVPNCKYYIYDSSDNGCECLDSKVTQKCDWIRGPREPSHTSCELKSTTTPITTTTSTTPSTTSSISTSTTKPPPPTSSTKLLVVTGGFDDQYYNDGLKSEIIDLENENLVCEDLSNAPYVISYGTGGFVNNNPVICGGFDGSKQLNICFVLGQNDILTLEYARSVAASIVFNNKLWITGGFGDPNSGATRTSEIVEGSTITRGPDLPWEFYRHCATQINSTHGILIGGPGNLKGSLIVNLNNFEMSSGPDLTGVGRREHVCTKFNHKNGTNYVVIAGGIQSANHPYLTTELLNVDDSNRGWFPGPDIPTQCVDGSIVTSPNGQGAIMLGCSRNPEQLYEMKWDFDGASLQWSVMKQTLKYPKYETVAMLIPEELTNCT